MTTTNWTRPLDKSRDSMQPPSINRTVDRLAWILLLLHAQPYKTRAQDMCNCLPARYEFELDLDQDCDSSNVIQDNSTGVLGISCAASPFVNISQVILEEISLDSNVVASFQSAPGDYDSGFRFSFTSSRFQQPSPTSNAEVVSNLLFSLVGAMNDGTIIQGAIMQLFVNQNCSQFPILQGGGVPPLLPYLKIVRTLFP